MNSTTVAEASWRELLSRQYLPRLAIMALALWLHASNSMLTATTMPSAVDEIGGLNLLSWTFALYLAGSITAAASISLLVANLGLKTTMIRTAVVFSIGCVVVATAPNMPVLLVGRVLQGLGGGGLIALVYLPLQRVDDGVVQRAPDRRSLCHCRRMAPGLLGLRRAGHVVDSGGTFPVEINRA
jgi:hypothetical protein